MEERNLERIDFLHESLAFQRKFKKQTEEQNELTEEILEKKRKEREARLKKADKYNEDDYQKYLPLIGNIRKDSHAGMFLFLMISMRRIVMLYLAMYVRGMPWLQLQIFIQLNFISFTYVFAVRPFERADLNFLNIFNEMIGLLASYCLLPLQDSKYDP